MSWLDIFLSLRGTKSSVCHCESAEGRRGNLKAGSGQGNPKTGIASLCVLKERYIWAQIRILHETENAPSFLFKRNTDVDLDLSSGSPAASSPSGASSGSVPFSALAFSRLCQSHGDRAIEEFFEDGDCVLCWSFLPEWLGRG